MADGSDPAGSPERRGATTSQPNAEAHARGASQSGPPGVWSPEAARFPGRPLAMLDVGTTRLERAARKRRTAVVIVQVALVIALYLVPSFITNTYDRMLFDQTLINIMAVVGLNFITGLTGQVNLGMAGIVAAGAYTSALLTTKLAVSPWVTLGLAVVVGVVIGIMLGWPSLRIKGINLA